MDHNKSISRLGRAILIVVFLCSVLSPACTPKIIEKIVVQHDTTAVHHRDTTYRRDSIYIKEWMKGDTVFVDRYRDRYIYRDRWRDSVSIHEVHDTTTVEKKVEKELSWSQKTRLNLFPWLLVLVIGAGLWIFRKPLLKLLKITS